MRIVIIFALAFCLVSTNSVKAIDASSAVLQIKLKKPLSLTSNSSSVSGTFSFESKETYTFESFSQAQGHSARKDSPDDTTFFLRSTGLEENLGMKIRFPLKEGKIASKRPKSNQEFRLDTVTRSISFSFIKNDEFDNLRHANRLEGNKFQYNLNKSRVRRNNKKDEYSFVGRLTDGKKALGRFKLTIPGSMFNEMKDAVPNCNNFCFNL